MNGPATDIVAGCIRAIAALPGVVGCAATPTKNPKHQGQPDLLVTLAAPREQWQLRIALSAYDGTQLPDIYLESGASLLAHVSHYGKICFNDEEGLSLDFDRPVDVVAHALEDAIATLDKAIEEHRAKPYEALLDEMEGYWNSIAGAKLVDSFVEIDTVAREIYAVITADSRTQELHTFVDSCSADAGAYGGQAKVRGKTKVCALYLPLQTPILPPSPATPISNDILVQLHAALSGPDREELARIANRKLRDKRRVYLLISQPRPRGGRATFGLAVHRQLGTALFANDDSAKLTALHVVRHDTEHVRARGGAKPALARSRVVVVGCGSVGSRIAEFLALSGVGHLTLVDDDILTSENIYRHLLGGADIGKPKAKALAAHLENRLPGIHVVPFVGTLAQWEAKGDRTAVDAVVLAIGDITVERLFTRRWRQTPYSRIAVVTWLEALGLGGHALLFSADHTGCLECLYSLSEGQRLAVPKTSFVASGQVLSRNLTGCGGAFTPFSALDAVKTAERAVDLCIEGLTSTTPVRYLSWKGSDSAARRENIQTTEWYREAPATLEADGGHPIFSCTCATCGATTA